MAKKGIIFLCTAVFTALFFNACLTTGDRVNMEDFKRQLEAGGQAMDVTGTAEAETAAEEPAAKETKVVVTAAATQEPTEEKEQTAEPTVVIKAAVEPVEKAVATVVEKKPVIETKTEPVVPAGQAGKSDYKWILVAVFAGAFAVFALIAFILSRKKKDEDEGEYKEIGAMPGPESKTVVVPEKAVEEYREAAALKKENQGYNKVQEGQGAQGAQGAQKVEPVKKEPYTPPVHVDEDAEAAKAGLSQPIAAAPASQVTVPEKGQYGEGVAGISPTQFAAGSQGNAVHFLYKVGGDSPEFRTIKITVPEGWSNPGMVNTDEGYFTATVNGGRLISTSAENRTMIIAVHGLPALTGEVAVTYGERRGGSPGVKVQPQPGEGVFKIETEGRGAAELKEILDSPVVDVN